ncbi:MAG: DUF2685 domain-containing protein [Aeromonas veronii]
MEKQMKICVVCKTPIETGLEIQTHQGDVHPGPCLSLIRERSESLNESGDMDEVEMIL